MQIKEEVKGVLEFISYVYKIFGFTFDLKLSTVLLYLFHYPSNSLYAISADIDTTCIYYFNSHYRYTLSMEHLCCECFSHFPHAYILFPCIPTHISDLQRPEKYLGDIETWVKAEAALSEALNEHGKPWEVCYQFCWILKCKVVRLSDYIYNDCTPFLPIKKQWFYSYFWCFYF